MSVASPPFPPPTTAPAQPGPSGQPGPSALLATGQPQPSGPARPDRHATPTPRVLGRVRTLTVVTCLVFVAAAVLGTLMPRTSIETTAERFSHAQRVRAIASDLARADQMSAEVFVAEKPTQAGLATYRTLVDGASQQIIQAAAAYPGDAAPLGEVQTSITEYQRQVENAVALLASDQAAAFKTYVAAAAPLDTAVDALDAIAARAEADTGAARMDAYTVAAVVVGWVTLALLLVASVVTARRTHRVLNLGLVLAVIAVLWATLALTTTATDVVTERTQQADTVRSTQLLTRAQTGAYLARATEIRRAFPPLSTSLDATLLTRLDQVTADLGAAAGSDQTLIQSWTTYATTAKTLTPGSADAIKNARSTGSFQRFASGIDEAIAAQATNIDPAARTTPLTLLAAGAALAGLIAALGAGLGITQRLREYR